MNRPSEINETSINQAKSIEELTLDDLTLDYVQFAEIREVLRRNQAKLVNEDDIKYETDSEDTDETVSGHVPKHHRKRTGHPLSSLSDFTVCYFSDVISIIRLGKQLLGLSRHKKEDGFKILIRFLKLF